ncbi:MAG: hypothetical protein IPO81_18990 [Kouleothrix sp.]|nr:hypothetical protein [Kouleothrix sp.]
MGPTARSAKPALPESRMMGNYHVRFGEGDGETRRPRGRRVRPVPTLRSGAFLFAAIKILKPIYEQVLDRMALLAERRKADGMPFREILDAEQAHPNRDYFITKSIVVRNLYGVDLMEEATEICKLRLFLRLVADLEDAAHVEPLPDIDFNIRAGNALVGYATVEEIGGGYKGGIAGLPKRVQQTVQDVEVVQRELSIYRNSQLQLNPSSDVFRQTRQSIRDKIGELNEALDADMLKMGQISREPNGGFNTQPFHWFTAFYEILSNGGFDVIVGNPPWREYSAVRKNYRIYGYKTEKSGNLYALCTERALSLCRVGGRMSFIVQLPLVSSSRMASVRSFLRQSSETLFVATFDDRPGKLFEGLQNCRSVIFISQRAHSPECKLSVTRYHRWPTEFRPHIFDVAEYAQIQGTTIFPDLFPKYANNTQEALFRKMKSKGRQTVDSAFTNQESKNFIFYQEATRYWIKATVGLSYYAKNGIVGAPAHGRYLYFRTRETAHATCALLNSSLFYAYFIAYGDCFHLSDTLVSGFPVSPELLTDKRLVTLNERLMSNLKANAWSKTIQTSDGDTIQYAEFYGAKSKHIIDQIDRVLAQHYGFTDEELDFIINYDIKYRMGRDANGARDEE